MAKIGIPGYNNDTGRTRLHIIDLILGNPSGFLIVKKFIKTFTFFEELTLMIREKIKPHRYL